MVHVKLANGVSGVPRDSTHLWALYTISLSHIYMVLQLLFPWHIYPAIFLPSDSSSWRQFYSMTVLPVTYMVNFIWTHSFLKLFYAEPRDISTYFINSSFLHLVKKWQKCVYEYHHMYVNCFIFMCHLIYVRVIFLMYESTITCMFCLHIVWDYFNM